METGTAIYAWELMTNHVLLRSGSSGLSRYMRWLVVRAKSDERILGSSDFVEQISANARM